jgi:hypothetical protein
MGHDRTGNEERTARLEEAARACREAEGNAVVEERTKGRLELFADDLFAAAQALQDSAGARAACTWREDDEGNWDTMCGGRFVVLSGTPSANAMAFCCYCGAALEEVRFEAEP